MFARLAPPLAIVGSLAPLLFGQTREVTFSTEVSVVNVFATVRDERGALLIGLRQEDFSIEEDGRPQTIRYFAQESDIRLTLGLLVDTSGSQIRVLDAERRASHAFLRKVLREGKDRAFIIAFDRTVELLQDITSSRAKLEAALAGVTRNLPPRPRVRIIPGRPQPRVRLPSSAGGTALFDAVFLASDEIMKPQSGRKALILLSDGGENGSRVKLTRSIESAQRADTLVYSILFAALPATPTEARSMEARSYGQAILEQFARETGGGYLEISQENPLDRIYARIEEELRNQYSLGYTSDQSGPGLRALHVSVKRENCTVRARDGYYALK